MESLGTKAKILSMPPKEVKRNSPEELEQACKNYGIYVDNLPSNFGYNWVLIYDLWLV